MKTKMKKIMVLLLISCLGFSGCGKERGFYASKIPDISKTFPNAKVKVIDEDGEDGDYYILQLTDGYTEEELDVFISGCLKKGFTDVVFHETDAFGAYSEDGEFWVQAQINKDGLYIFVQRSQNYDEE